MAGPYLLALDQGTSSSRALVVDTAGAIRACAARPFAQHYPRPGWVEHDPEEIWTSQIEAAREAIAAADIEPREIAAIGLANQRETALIWERASGRPIANAIVWQCRRTAEMCEALQREGAAPLIRERTGLVIDAYFSGTKYAWLLDHVPGARERAVVGELLCGTVDTWLLWRLTGGKVHATDRTNASRTLLYDLHRERWDADLCALLRVPEVMLPRVLPSAADFGETTLELFGRPIPLRGVAGDQQAALFGQGCIARGDTKCTYGTGAFILRYLGAESAMAPEGMLLTAAASADSTPAYAWEGSVFIAGAAVQWLRDGLGIVKSAPEIEALAASVQDSGGVQIVPAFVGLGAPFWDPRARGAILGLTRGSTAAHIARATLEAIAFQTRAVLDVMAAEEPLHELRVDGGAAANNLLLQIQADILGAPVLRPREVETTALGAAYLAGIAAGVLPADAPRALWQLDARFLPAIDAPEREQRYALWRRAVERASGWIEEEEG
jgi:glycerol kinase